MVNEQAQLELERRLHGLIAGGLDGPARREVLRLVAEDAAAGELLAEILAVQEAARAAYGYDGAEPDIAAFGAARIANGPSVAARPTGSVPVFASVPRLAAPARWAFRVAAAIVVAVSIFAAVTARRQGPPAAEPTVQAAAISRAELDRYRLIWRQVADASQTVQPWVLLSYGQGEFGYLPAAAGQGAGGAVLLRCLVLGPDGETMERLNVLLPAHRAVRLDLLAAGELAGEPVHCKVATDEGGASVYLTVGDDSHAPVGVSGRVGLDETSMEIGQFNLHGRRMRVVVQVVPLDTALG